MKRSDSFAEIFLSIGKGILEILKGLIRLVLKIFVTFGLWLPGIYALIGVILYYGLSFNPFTLNVYSVIYLSGGVVCVVFAIILATKNVFYMPFKNASERRRNRAFEDEEYFAKTSASEDENEKRETQNFSVPVYKDYESEDKNKADAETNRFSGLGKIKVRTQQIIPNEEVKPKREKPKVYKSKLRDNIMVHEYSDRFELYKIDTGEFYQVQYKTWDE